MKNPKMHEHHQCAPAEWRHTPDMTGSYEMDCVIARCKNKDMQQRLRDHLTEDVAYKINTAYGRGPIG